MKTDPETVKQANRPNRFRRIARMLGLVVFLVIAAFFIAVIARYGSIQRSTAREITQLEVRRAELKETAAQLKDISSQIYEDERTILNVLKESRTAEDIPDLQGNRIVAQHQGIDDVWLYVPEGSHKLEIKSIWKVNESEETDGKTSGKDSGDQKANGEEAEGGGEKHWSVPLLPASGYLLHIQSGYRAGPVQWELTSNHPDFEAQAGTVPLGDFDRRGSSWSGEAVIAYPNQITKWYSVKMLAEKLAASDGVGLRDATLRGSSGGHSLEIRFEVRIVSNSPATISARDAKRLLILGGEHLLGPYRGGGKYELKEPGVTAMNE